MVCEFSQPKKGPCENRLPLRNAFPASYLPLRKFSQLRNHPLAHECHFAAPYTHFAAAKWLRNISTPQNSSFRSRDPTSQVVSQLRNHPLAHECHFTAPPPHFAAVKWATKWPTKMALGCEMASMLQNKLQIISKLRNHLQVVKSQIQLAKSKFKLAKWIIQRVNHLAKSTCTISDSCNRLSQIFFSRYFV